LIGGLLARRTVAARALALRPVAWFGRNGSYSLYLWHVPIIALVLPLVPGPAGVVAAIVASVLVAIASHYAIERPFARLRRRLEPRMVKRSAEGGKSLVGEPLLDELLGDELVDGLLVKHGAGGS
jgi:peptidoglycan/LPS O-acetylase OafA/YrhL